MVGSDPEGMGNFRRKLGDAMEYAADPYECATGADAVILCTEWMEFRAIDFAKLRKVVKEPVLFDGRNVLDRKAANAAGFEYEGIGLGQLLQPARETEDAPTR